MSFLGAQKNLNSTIQDISTTLSTSIHDSIKINENIDTEQSNINSQTLEVNDAYLRWRSMYCKNKGDNSISLGNIIKSDTRANSNIKSDVRVTQYGNINNVIDNELSNENDQSNTGVAVGIQSNSNATAQSISNEIYNQINQNIDYTSNINTRQGAVNIQNLYITGNKDGDPNISNEPLFDKPQFKTLKDQLYSPGVNSGPGMQEKYKCSTDSYGEMPSCPFFAGLPNSLIDPTWCLGTLDCETVGNNIESVLYSGSTIENSYDISQKSISSNTVINKISNKNIQSNAGLDLSMVLLILIVIFAIICIGPFMVGFGSILNIASGLFSGPFMILILLWFLSFGLFIYEITFNDTGGGCIWFPGVCPASDDSIGCSIIHTLLSKDGFGCNISYNYPLEVK
tara:strand:- start:2090 stop:3283 length:1194 start_codon:yes stop_codon:yes gene_type:complete